jgi:hypothetical protein
VLLPRPTSESTFPPFPPSYYRPPRRTRPTSKGVAPYERVLAAEGSPPIATSTSQAAFQRAPTRTYRPRTPCYPPRNPAPYQSVVAEHQAVVPGSTSEAAFCWPAPPFYHLLPPFKPPVNPAPYEEPYED